MESSTTTWFKFKQLFRIKFRQKTPPPPPSDDFSRNPNITPTQAAWLTSFYSEPDTQEGIRARAVAAATAAAADAAIAAARAAYEAVRVTSGATSFGGCRENLAALNIQRVFRGFLARKALRSLKGLVKIQAQVRGFLVRKRAAAALQSMEALLRAQASVRHKKINLQPKFRDKKSLDIGHESPKIVEVDTWCRPKSRSKRIIISKWITESTWMEDHFQQPLATPLTSTPRHHSRDTWGSTKTVRSKSAPKSRRGSVREEEGMYLKKAVMGKLGVD